MTTLRLYIWEGDGISDAYHDDGTLVVLAESPEGARALVRAKRAEREAQWEAYTALPIEKRREAVYPEFASSTWDGSDKALDREPDRIEDLDVPKWIAFNGGGYD